MVNCPCLTTHWFINSLSKALSRCIQSGTINKLSCIRCSPQGSASSPTCEPHSHHVVPLVPAQTLGTKLIHVHVCSGGQTTSSPCHLLCLIVDWPLVSTVCLSKCVQFFKIPPTTTKVRDVLWTLWQFSFSQRCFKVKKCKIVRQTFLSLCSLDKKQRNDSACFF